MIRRIFSSGRMLLFYSLLLLPMAWFAWGSLTGRRLLGDDNESTETLGNTAGRRGSSGHARFYHK
ncbi:hypothetical protein [Hymenobacter arizonensis]|uniref:Uncharacterized protein n=1 Tax=Hymenobacter arizonensis TaxID=1227077 RepID=A0A1I5UZF2_HYMAR|nr:hypothetical protein [Hymenobacter arizonensis]SFQ00598.1 hypothetical protein SAMN04515668_1133 [Hymenobacter arizonensis]